MTSLPKDIANPKVPYICDICGKIEINRVRFADYYCKKCESKISLTIFNISHIIKFLNSLESKKYGIVDDAYCEFAKTYARLVKKYKNEINVC